MIEMEKFEIEDHGGKCEIDDSNHVGNIQG